MCRSIVRLCFGVGLGLMVWSMSALAQPLVWEQTGGPLGGSVVALVEHPAGALFAALSSGGLLQWDDDEQEWGATNCPSAVS